MYGTCLYAGDDSRKRRTSTDNDTPEGRKEGRNYEFNEMAMPIFEKYFSVVFRFFFVFVLSREEIRREGRKRRREGRKQ